MPSGMAEPIAFVLLSRILVGLVAVLHVWFLVLEMFLWTKPLGRKLLRTTAEQAEATAVLAKNQGLYNGFLAAGLFWALRSDLFFPLAVFFLGCIIVAGLYGAMTASKNILFLQALPAAAALGAVWLSR